jgi:hypothetical protein
MDNVQLYREKVKVLKQLNNYTQKKTQKKKRKTDKKPTSLLLIVTVFDQNIK